MKLPWKKPDPASPTIADLPSVPHEPFKGSRVAFNKALYHTLAGWRHKLAEQEGVNPQAILTDEQLKVISATQPITGADLRDLPIDRVRLALLSEDILGITSIFEEQ